MKYAVVVYYDNMEDSVAVADSGVSATYCHTSALIIYKESEK